MRGTAVWEGVERQGLRRRIQQMERAQPGQRPDPSQPAGTDRLPQIKHIVLLMMENHSFDNYLGTLGRGEGFDLGADGQPEAENADASGQAVRAYHLPSTAQHSGVPYQSWRAAHTQFADGKMTGFVTATQAVSPAADKSVAMGYWTAADLPFYHGLASTFPLADRWFSSCLGPTFPNRRFLLAGTAHGLMDDLPVNLLDYPPAGTIFDMLTKYGKSWVNYRPDGGDQSQFRRYLNYRRRRSQHHLRALGRPFQRARRVEARPAVHDGSLPTRDGQIHAAYPRHRRFLRGRRRRQLAGLLHCRSGLQRVFRGESAGHPQGRELCGRGHPSGHARQGLGRHAAHLDL